MCRPIPWWFGQPARQAAARWRARPLDLLRRHRQDGGRADPLEDRHQRAVARLMDEALDFQLSVPGFGGDHSAPVWRRWTLALTGLCLLLAAVWASIGSWTHRDLAIGAVRPQGVPRLRLSAALRDPGSAGRRSASTTCRPSVFAPAGARALGCASGRSRPSRRARRSGRSRNLFGLMPAFAPWLVLLVALAAFACAIFELGLRPD